jgi:VCBS repeat-containing protein
VAAFDGVNLSAPSTIALTVTPVDDLPVGVPDLITATEDGDPVVGDVLANDINLDSPIDTLSVIALRTGTVGAGSGTAGSVGNPLVGSYGSLTVNANGGYSYTLDNALATVQALKSGETLSDRFTYTLSDGHSTAEADITVTVERQQRRAADHRHASHPGRQLDSGKRQQWRKSGACWSARCSPTSTATRWPAISTLAPTSVSPSTPAASPTA